MALENFWSSLVETKQSQQEELSDALQWLKSEKIESKHEINENLKSLEDEIIWWDEEKLDQKDFTWDERTQTLLYSYRLWTYKWATISLQKKWDQVHLILWVHNEYFLWSNTINKSFNKKEINKIPEFIHNTFQNGVALKTYGDTTIEKKYIPNNYLLSKIEEKAKKAITIIKKHL